jgi:Na+(H+)/acetate symporter ActP
MNKHLLSIAALALAASAFNPALVHGIGTPKHGGVMSATSGMSFDLVAGNDGAAI